MLHGGMNTFQLCASNVHWARGTPAAAPSKMGLTNEYLRDARARVGRSILHRHSPAAAAALRRAVMRPLLAAGILMYARAAAWVDRQRASGGRVLLMPTCPSCPASVN